MITKFPFEQIAFGGDYNPEQWPEEIWPEDVRLMREAGVNLVSLAIFAWAKLEPSPGHYDFDWLDRIIDLLHQNGIAICLATATASPPPWFSRLHPESLPVTEQGVRLEIGSRQQYSPANRAFREAAAHLCSKLAERYAHHPAVVLWHLNNEYSCHVAMSYDAETAQSFRHWLQNRYKTLAVLNDAWGTAVWSQSYSDWEEIQPPRQSPTFPNPGQVLDFQRFSSDAWRELCRIEIQAVRAFNPSLPVTTNFMGNLAKGVDQFDWAADLDVCAWDSYPDPTDLGKASTFAAVGHDLTRSLRGGQPFLLMEQVTSQVNWRPLNALKPPGLMRAQSWQAVARGADAVMFFQWRAARVGAEKFHGALVPHTGITGSRIWREVCQIGKELNGCSELIGSRVPAQAAILLDWSNWWAVETAGKPRQLSYPEIWLQYYRAFYHQNIPVDFAAPSGDLSRYKLIVAPLLYLLDERSAENLRQFVQQGGTLVTTWFSGIVDEQDRVLLGGYPNRLRDVLGLRVMEWQPLAPGHENSIRWPNRRRAITCDFWADWIEPQDCDTLATFERSFLAGAPAITRHAYGRGQAWYLASRFEEQFTRELFLDIAKQTGIHPLLKTPEGVEISLRQNDQNRWLFIINHTETPQQIDLGPHNGLDLLQRSQISGRIELEPFDVRILRLSYPSINRSSKKQTKPNTRKGLARTSF